MLHEVPDITLVETHGRFQLDDVIVLALGADNDSIPVHLLFDHHRRRFIRFPTGTTLDEFDPQEQANPSEMMKYLLVLEQLK